MVDEAKNKPCGMCGGEFPAVCMDLHHRDPAEKEFILSSELYMFGFSRIEKEIAKCDVLCANCHRLHHARMEQGLPQEPTSAQEA